MKKTLLRILWGIVGVILIAAGIVCFCNPDITTAALAIIFGVVLLISGITDIVIFAKYNRFMFGAAWFLVDAFLQSCFPYFLFSMRNSRRLRCL